MSRNEKISGEDYSSGTEKSNFGIVLLCNVIFFKMKKYRQLMQKKEKYGKVSEPA